MDCPPHEIPLLRGPVPLSHLIIRQFVREGDHAVDATCGNGNDTLLLARLAGKTGRVWAFDIQQLAIEATHEKLVASGLDSRVELIRAGHETIAEHCTWPIKAVVFNLGYLPGSDRSVVTLPETTGIALEQSSELMVPGGIIAITIYPGHDGGARERRVVDAWAAHLDERQFHSWRMGQLNTSTEAPYFILVQKAS